VALGLLPHRHQSNAALSGNLESEALELVGLERFAERRLDQLSGGERQKAKIARAICQRPVLLILDEPTNHLDPQARGELLGLVAKMGITIVAALHDLTLIEAFAHKVVVVADGEMLAFGRPSDVMSMDRIRSVFGVEMHRFAHPDEDRLIPALDIPVAPARGVTGPDPFTQSSHLNRKQKERP